MPSNPKVMALLFPVNLACAPDEDLFHAWSSLEGKAACGMSHASSSDVVRGVVAEIECEHCLNLIDALPNADDADAKIWKSRMVELEKQFPGISKALSEAEKSREHSEVLKSSPHFKKQRIFGNYGEEDWHWKTRKLDWGLEA
jgi:hypothetical protein